MSQQESSKSAPNQIQLPAEMRAILEVLAQTLLRNREQTHRDEANFKQYVMQCADALGVNENYTFDPNKVAFIENANGSHPKG